MQEHALTETIQQLGETVAMVAALAPVVAGIGLLLVAAATLYTATHH
jgi:hypothetical protein